MSIVIATGSGGTTQADVTNGNLAVTLPTTISETGYAVAIGEAHDGATGASRILRPTVVTIDDRLKTGVDNLAWQETFNHTLLPAGSYQAVTSTATLVVGGGVLSFNDGASVASGAVARVQTYRTFPLFGFAASEIRFRVRFAISAQTNNTAELGFGFATGTATPTDGAYFKMNTSGGLEGVANFNGTEFTVSLGTSVVANTFYDLRMVLDQNRLEFYVQDVCRGVINLVDVSASLATPTMTFARSLPLLMRLLNAASTTGAQKMQISGIEVVNDDLATNKPWTHTKAGSCENSFNVPSGTTAGSTANYATSAAPATGTPSASVAGYSTLGGQWQIAAPAGAETDLIMFGYTVPAAAVAGGNKNLYVTGIRISTVNTGATVATTATILQWGLAIGATAVTTATADSLTAGTRAYRRVALGMQGLKVGDLIGAQPADIDVQFQTPFLCEPGTVFTVLCKVPVGTATASQVLRGTVLVNGYWE